MRTKQRPPICADDYVEEDHGFESPCWVWRGRKNNKGYGSIRLAGRVMYAHRAMYEQEVAPIPEGLQIDHLCRVRACVNPDHMEVVTHSENLWRGKGSKVTKEQVLAIRRDTRTLREIGADYGIDGSQVSRIRNRRKWANLEEES